MKNLDLDAYGVSEMSNAEMCETDGGWVIVAAIATIIWASLEITERAGYAAGLRNCTC